MNEITIKINNPQTCGECLFYSEDHYECHVAVQVTCENRLCVWRFDNGHCLKRKCKIDAQGRCQCQEQAVRVGQNQEAKA